MRILDVKSLPIPDAKVIRFGRFSDSRGYFSEPYRRGVVDDDARLDFFRGIPIAQVNESWSREGVVRGLHFQWNPFMGKLVRTISGRMVDLALDIRLDSPSFGKILAYDMPCSSEAEYSEWIWVPPGFAHGNLFTEETVIEYFCTGEYSPGNEAGVSPLASDLDWSLSEPALREEFRARVDEGAIISDKDRDAASLSDWRNDPRSANFRYSELAGSGS
jgi:dTDP-4-dehydrorhamnose 3,5-epimerase